MWKIVAILVLTVTVMLLARLVYKRRWCRPGLARAGIELRADAEMPKTPPFIYAGIRG